MSIRPRRNGYSYIGDCAVLGNEFAVVQVKTKNNNVEAMNVFGMVGRVRGGASSRAAP